MKILGLHVGGEHRVGVIDDEEVIDLQEVDNRIPPNLADWLREHGGNLKPLAEAASCAGDIILTGTPSGVGHARTPPVWMRKNDVCEVEIALAFSAISSMTKNPAPHHPSIIR